MEPTKEDKPVQSIINFLLGVSDYQGKWYGDNSTPTYWWRSVLRNEIQERDAKIAELEYKVGDLIGCIMETRGEVLQLKSENERLELDKATKYLHTDDTNED